MHKGLIRIAAVLGPALAVLVLGSSVADAQEKRTSRIKGAQEVVPEEESYTFLARQGALLFDYGKFHQATESFVQACGTEEGALDPDC